MSGTIMTLAVLGVAAYVFIHRDEFGLGGNIADLIKSGGAAAPAPVAAAAPDTTAAAAVDTSQGEYDPKTGTYKPPKGGYKAPAGGYKNTGGYKGMPGWYTAQGHHHCTKGEKGCVCTDPKKCLGIRGTGHEACAGGVCAPGPGECRPDLGRYGAGPCGDCPPGTGGGKCAAGGQYAGKYGNVLNSFLTVSNNPDPYPDVDPFDLSDDVSGRYIDLGICVRHNEIKYNPIRGY